MPTFGLNGIDDLPGIIIRISIRSQPILLLPIVSTLVPKDSWQGLFYFQ